VVTKEWDNVEEHAKEEMDVDNSSLRYDTN
jgi:hypothetical protein